MQGAKYYDGHLTTHNKDIVNPFFKNVKAVILFTVHDSFFIIRPILVDII